MRLQNICFIRYMINCIGTYTAMRSHELHYRIIMNPIKIALLTLGAWTLLAIVFIYSLVEDVSERPFEIAVYSFYLMPFICIIAFSISLFFYRSWVKKNRTGFGISLIILVLWALYVAFYIRSLFI